MYPDIKCQQHPRMPAVNTEHLFILQLYMYGEVICSEELFIIAHTARSIRYRFVFIV